MALLWFDGLDGYGVTADLNTIYTASGSVSYSSTGGYQDPTSSIGNGGRMNVGAGSMNYTKNFPTAGTNSNGAGFHYASFVKFTTLASSARFIEFLNNVNPNSGTNAAQLKAGSDGSLSVTQQGATGTTLATSAAGVISTNTWYHIEYSAKYNTSGNGGFVKVWVNGNLVIDFSGDTNTGTVPSNFTGISWRTSSGSHAIQIDDIVCWDENGTDFVLTQLSTDYIPYIETKYPNGDSSVQFTRSGGSNNYEMVDEAGFNDGDTTYNSSTTIGHEDELDITNQGGTPAITYAIACKTTAKINVAGTINLRTGIDSGGTNADSADRLLGTSYVQYHDYFGKNPNGSAAWANTDFNALKSRYKYQS